MNSSVKHISEWFIKPKIDVEQSKLPYHLAPLDLDMLSFHYIQDGLLYTKPSDDDDLNNNNFSINSFIDSLKESLSETLIHFYPLAGQLVVDFDDTQCRVFVDCNKGPGARLYHASALDITVSDILSPNYVPSFVASFFDYNEEAVNYDGHKKPLLSIQVTELADGVFVACSINHSVADGTSYWHFWNVWSEIHLHRSTKGSYDDDQLVPVSRLPIHSRWFPEGCVLPIPLPFTDTHQLVKRFEPPQLREKIFHFSSESIASLKAKASIQCSSNCNNNNAKIGDEISSFQALSALVWRSMVRANHVPHDQVLYNYIIANNRHRLNPPLPEYYFGTCILGVTTKTTAGELLENNIGWAASLLHQSVVSLTDKVVREFVKEWTESPFCYHHASLHDYNTIAMEHSPRFNMYGNEFGLGKPVAVRNGPGNKAVGVVFCYPGYEGGGSVDLEICLPPDSMKALETDDELMAFVSLPN